MYGQGNYAPQFGQGNQTPRPPFQQLSVNPNFPQGRPNVTPPFQYHHLPPMPGQHGPPVRLPANGVPNASHSFHRPPRPPQVHFSAQQNTLWAQSTQRVPLPPSPPLAPPPPGPYRPEIFQPSVLYRGSIFTPQPSNAQSTSQLPPPPPPLPMDPTPPQPPPPLSMGPTPPPLPPSSPPPIPPSPPPTVSPKASGALTSTALYTACESPHILKSGSTFIGPVSEMQDSDSGDKVVATTENMDDKHLTGRTSAEVRSPASENLSSEERGSSVQTDLMDADVSPSVSDMEMEDDFTQPDDIHCKTVFIPEEHVNQEQSCGLQNVIERNPPQDTVPTFSQLAEEEKGRGSRLSLQNDQPKRESTFPVVDSLIASPTRAAKLEEDRFIGVSSSSPSEDTNSTAKSPGELIKDASPFRLIPNYSSDDSSDHKDKTSLGDLIPMTMPPSNTICDTSLCGDLQSNLLTDRGPKILPSRELAYERSSTGTINDEVFAVSHEDFRGKDVLDVAHEVAPEKKKTRNQIKDLQHTPILRKVDEFGRLVRDVSSDSDPDESRRTRKHGRSRRSRSRSPHDRRSRRSPPRRRERRSWSRSWSPKRRKSRSRSPSHRRGIESGGERGRKDKGRLPDCLDFLRGRCHRGASCRYMHHETDKSAGARYNRSTRTSDLGEEPEKMPSKKSIHENKTLNRQELLFPAQGFVQTTVSDLDDKIPVADVSKFKKSNETTLMVLESSDLKEIFESSHKLPDTEHCREKEESDHAVDRSSRLINDGIFVSSLVDDCHGIASSTDDLAIEKSLAKNQIEINESDLNKNVSSVSNQGAQPAPPPPVSHGTSVPPPIQPPLNYPYQGHFQMQQPCYPTPPNIWSLPPPPPLQPQFANNFSAPTPMQGIPPPFQQNQLPPKMFQHHGYPELSPQIEDIRSKRLSMDNNASQTPGTHLSSFPLPSLGLPTTRNIQSYPGKNLPSNEFSAPSSQSHTHSLQQQQYNYGNMNAPFGGSKIAPHYNPYASTFDLPFDTKFNSNVLDQGKDLPYANPYGASHSLSHTPVDPQALICPPKTTELPKSGSDQYDPLFDSIEPSSNSFKKLDESQGLESTLRLSSSRKALDVGENSKHKEVEIAAISVSIKSNEEFGETADADVGEVESGKSSNPLDEGHVVVGEVEIDQLKSPGKGKKSKDSKSMKLFKSSLAEYVKEVLKPHWRQGGMSKEAFKIIVKKTIDKVSGAMKSHHIPKSQEKISRYIDSSERKLNKLVMGYVDKYAKI